MKTASLQAGHEKGNLDGDNAERIGDEADKLFGRMDKEQIKMGF